MANVRIIAAIAQHAIDTEWCDDSHSARPKLYFGLALTNP
jgi:hypothetical protein